MARFLHAGCSSWHISLSKHERKLKALTPSTEKSPTGLIIFRVRRSWGERYIGHGRLCACLSLAVFPHYCTDPDVTWKNGTGVPSNSALLGRFAIGARVSLLQHNAEREMSASACTRCMPGSFFIHHWNSEGRGVAPFTPVLQRRSLPQN